MRARPLNRRSLAAIEQAELDARGISKPTHYAIKRIHLTNQMAFAQTADSRIAGHRSRIIQSHGNQYNTGTHPRCSGRSFQACMARTYDKNIIMFHVKHLLADAEAREDLIKVVIRRNTSNHLTQAEGG